MNMTISFSIRNSRKISHPDSEPEVLDKMNITISPYAIVGKISHPDSESEVRHKMNITISPYAIVFLHRQ
ncbi:MAG: hypothetical protein F6K22_16035 [Okeania sp. SIO2F4]|uniref:hypothetical protein n=1 Tax=Okeania sp. SIO2F4 TaxID=2607790 RepID=UPI001429C27A|nr:hypothetical protein [Okeania sp. SIO2F4]NES04210.1 hypothetical protein [Okeania sp. SIO2F4]